MKRNPLFLSAAVAAAVLGLTQQSRAVDAFLSNGNSSANVSLDTEAGMNSWVVDGVNNLVQQWFAYRIGSGLGAPINTISAPNILSSTADSVLVRYTAASFSLDISYTLTGGSIGSGNADILETITVNNTSGSQLNFHFFQYSNFDLLGTPGGETVSISGSPGGYDFVYQAKGPTQIQEAITSPVANRAEGALLSGGTWNNIKTIAGYDLSNADFAGPGDVTWALQWDTVIEAGSTFDVFKDKMLSIQPVPEPSAMALVALGAGLFGFLRRRR